MRWVIPIIVFSLACSPAMASDLDPATQRFVSFVFGDQGPRDRKWRTDLVTVMTDYCLAVREAMPTNTPAEDDWVQRESETSDPGKIGRLVQTPEFGRRQLKETFDRCVFELREASFYQSRPPTDQGLSQEASRLLHLAQAFQNDGDIQLYAERSSFDGQPFAFEMVGWVRTVAINAAISSLDEIGARP